MGKALEETVQKYWKVCDNEGEEPSGEGEKGFNFFLAHKMS
jgi:predicted HicB family RNase H-like nuclease